MDARVIATGVELVLAADADSDIRRPSTPALDLGRDPTTVLFRYADDAWENQQLMGDIGHGDIDITRFEFYAAPHRVELSPALRERLATTPWKGRPPRFPG